MEFLNRIELRGVVGASSLTNVGGDSVARFSLATEYSYKSKDGTPVIETTWHNITAWASQMPEVRNIAKGDIIHIVGRLHQSKYTDQSGFARYVYDVYAQELEIEK